jgi:hypothetical protein
MKALLFEIGDHKQAALTPKISCEIVFPIT